jgi:hypothetical protein
MLKTWEKTCCRASIIVRNLDFSRWGGPPGCPWGPAGVLVPVRPGSGRTSAASGGGEVGGLRRLGQALSLPVLVERQRVDHQSVPEQIHVLAGVPDAVGPIEVQRVLQAAVDGLRVRPPNWN